MDKLNNLNLSAQISATDKVLIQPIQKNATADFDTTKEIVAINWFNLKSSFLYNIYSLLAIRYVRKVSGKLYFKGKMLNQLEGKVQHQRNNLLIVSYPNPVQFLKLVSYKFFQMISIFRILAVSKFCFGFTENIMLNKNSISNHNGNYTKQHCYLVHHFQVQTQWLRENIQQLKEAAEQHKVAIYYCGLTTANLVKETAGEKQAAELFMDGIIVFAADSNVQLEDFLINDTLSLFKSKNLENNLYLFSRTH